jgi:hypothetical protein
MPYPFIVSPQWDPLGRWLGDKDMRITWQILYWSVIMSHDVEDWSCLAIAHWHIVSYTIMSTRYSWCLFDTWLEHLLVKCIFSPWIRMIVATCKYYVIYITFLRGWAGTWVPLPSPVEPDGLVPRCQNWVIGQKSVAYLSGLGLGVKATVRGTPSREPRQVVLTLRLFLVHGVIRI